MLSIILCVIRARVLVPALKRLTAIGNANMIPEAVAYSPWAGHLEAMQLRGIMDKTDAQVLTACKFPALKEFKVESWANISFGEGPVLEMRAPWIRQLEALKIPNINTQKINLHGTFPALKRFDLPYSELSTNLAADLAQLQLPAITELNFAPGLLRISTWQCGKAGTGTMD